jgi:hypothetical protein
MKKRRRNGRTLEQLGRVVFRVAKDCRMLFHQRLDRLGKDLVCLVASISGLQPGSRTSPSFRRSSTRSCSGRTRSSRNSKGQDETAHAVEQLGRVVFRVAKDCRMLFHQRLDRLGTLLPTQFDSLMFWSDEELAELEGSTVLGKIGRDERLPMRWNSSAE